MSSEREPLVSSKADKNFYFAPARTRSNTIGLAAGEDDAATTTGMAEPIGERGPSAVFSIEGLLICVMMIIFALFDKL